MEQMYNDVQLEAHSRLKREVHQQQRQRDHTPPLRFGFEPAAELEHEGYEEATGCRLVHAASSRCR